MRDAPTISLSSSHSCCFRAHKKVQLFLRGSHTQTRYQTILKSLFCHHQKLKKVGRKVFVLKAPRTYFCCHFIYSSVYRVVVNQSLFYVVTSLLTRELFSFLIISSQGRKYIECARRRVWGPNTVVLKWSWKRASRAACREMNKKLERVLSLVSTSYHHPWSRQSLV